MLQQPEGRFLRLFSALVIAAAITAGMLYGMNEFAETLKLRDPTRYFHISKVIIPKQTGPAKRPQAAELPPPRAALDFGEQGQQHKQQGQPRVSLPPPPPLKTTPGKLRTPLAPPLPPRPSGTDQDTAGGQ